MSWKPFLLLAVAVTGISAPAGIGTDAVDAAARKAGRPSVGLLIVDHGEPPEYNELTYESFKKFFNHLIEMGLIPSWVRLIDEGTVVQNPDCYACEDAPVEGPFIDAWLDEHEGPAAPVPASDSLPAHFALPGGPGLGEPDIFEHVGLGAWHEWQLMGGRSPNYDQKLAKKKIVLSHLRNSDPGLPIAVGYGIDPRLNGGYQGFRPALSRLINDERVEHIVVAYHGVGFSDIMQTHMIRHELQEIAAGMDPDVKLSYAEPLGHSRHYIQAVVGKVRSELRSVPAGAKVAIHLSGHGLSTTMCGEYDCGADSYHASSQDLFRRTKRAISDEIQRQGLGVFHLYGEGAAEEDDPEDKVDSPMEALAERKKAGYEYVIDIPYEFDSDSRDTLIILRHGYERRIPDWNSRYESHFRYEGMDVKITNTQFGFERKVKAFEDVIRAALRAKSGARGHEH